MSPHKVTCGLLLANTPITWEKAEGSTMNRTGKSRVMTRVTW